MSLYGPYQEEWLRGYELPVAGLYGELASLLQVEHGHAALGHGPQHHALHQPATDLRQLHETRAEVAVGVHVQAGAGGDGLVGEVPHHDAELDRPADDRCLVGPPDVDLQGVLGREPRAEEAVDLRGRPLELDEAGVGVGLTEAGQLRGRLVRQVDAQEHEPQPPPTLHRVAQLVHDPA